VVKVLKEKTDLVVESKVQMILRRREACGGGNE
jgi:hypothetical protein